VTKKTFFDKKIRIHSGVMRVARDGSGAQAPPLSARPSSFPPFGGCLVINFSLSPEEVDFE